MREFSIFDFRSILLQLWQNKWILLSIMLSGLMAGMALTVNDEPDVRFRATSTVCVTYTTYQEQMRGSSVITNYSALVSSYRVCERAVEILGDADLTALDIQGMLESWKSSDSFVMVINATTTDPHLAIRVANAVAQAFIEKVSSVSGNNSLQVLDTAQTAVSLAKKINNLILASAFGPLILACAWIILWEIVSGKIRILSQCAGNQEELLGILPDME